MRVGELIKALGSVNPDVEVTVTTSDGSRGIERVVSSGYNGPITILSE